MKIENTKAQMRKGVLEYCILSILRDKDAYVAEILETLKDAKLLVVEGTIYPLLTRLKNAGLLSYRWEESTSKAKKILRFNRNRTTFFNRTLYYLGQPSNRCQYCHNSKK